MDSPKKVITKNTALARIENYCAYQERSQQETRYKLIELGVYGDELEEIISNLIQNNFLNEGRFATAYVTGKFRMKHWGKIKIKQGLKLKGVPEKLVVKALAQIDPDDYYNTLLNLLKKKMQNLGAKLSAKDRQKLSLYAYSKGYESWMINEALEEIRSQKS